MKRCAPVLLALTAACGAETQGGPNAGDAMPDASVVSEDDVEASDDAPLAEEPDAQAPADGPSPVLDAQTDAATPRDAAPPMDGSTPMDGSAPTDVSAPRDALLPMDVSAPRDALLPMDVSAPRDTATPTDAATPMDVSAPRDGSTADAARADAALADAPRADARPPVNDALGRDGELASGWTNTFVFVDKFGRDLRAEGGEALRGLGTTFVYTGEMAARVGVLRLEAGAWRNEFIGGLGYYGARRHAFVESSPASAVFFDEYYYSSGSLTNGGVFYGERNGDGTWRSERVLTAALSARSPVDGLCAFADGTAFIQNGSSSLQRAVRGSAGAWSVAPLTPTTYLSYNGFLACAQMGADKFIVTAQSASEDGLRAFRVGAGSMMAEESIAPTSDGRVWGASFLGSRLAYTVRPATVRTATRSASGVWTSTAIPFAVAAGGTVQHVFLTTVAGRTVLALVVQRSHPTTPGNSKDEVWVLDESRGWAATRVYVPSLGSVRIQRVASDGAALVLGISMTDYGFSYDIPGSYVYRVLRGTL